MLMSINPLSRQRSRWSWVVLAAIAGTLSVAMPKSAAADTIVISNGGFSLRTSSFGLSIGTPPGYYNYPAYSGSTVINGGTLNNATLNRPVIINSEINNSTLINPVIRTGRSGVTRYQTRVINRPHRGLDNIRNVQRIDVDPLNPYRYRY
ncbi:hypothetical protein [Almyronema epifaneia]|uniref:Uncharacterized protein n=1 Tax=Almyronema epifaneia S1 TaxID=2991925 RepID=A0ABW6IIE7_9CYAN